MGSLQGPYMESCIRTYLEFIKSISSRFAEFMDFFFFFFDPQCKCPCFIGVVEEGLSEFSRRNLTEILITLFMKSIRQAGEGQYRPGQGSLGQSRAGHGQLAACSNVVCSTHGLGYGVPLIGSRIPYIPWFLALAAVSILPSVM